MSWTPVMIDSEYKSTIYNIINIISSELCEDNTSNDISLMAGKLGKSLFFSYLDRSSNNIQHEQQILNSIFAWQKALEANQIDYSLSSGLCGYIYYINYLCKVDFLEKADVSNLLDDLIKVAAKYSEKTIDNNNFDFLHGGFGLSVSLFNYKSSNQSLLNEYFQKIIEYLNNSQFHLTTDAVLWASRHHISNKNIFNLGLAHGNPSIINILINIYREQNNNKQLEELIVKGINGILNVYDVNQLCFPNYIDVETMQKGENSRIAWCYGDLGIAITLVKAGISFSNDEWIAKGIEIGLKTCNRKGVKETHIVDAGLCHGSSGVALIYSRLYNYTHKVEFKNSAQFWYTHTIKNAFDDKDCLNYKAWDDVDSMYKKDFGFLEGIAGIGLSLLSSISDKEPIWDKSLLLC